MSEPRASARRIVAVVPDVHRWSVADDRIGGAESDAYAVAEGGHLTLVDPLPVDPALLSRLGEVEAIVLTAPCHQRASWRFRRMFGAPVFAPESARVGRRPGELEEAPDIVYTNGDVLSAGLIAVHSPGPDEHMHALWLDRRRAAFVSDLLVHDGGGAPRFVPDEYQEAPWRTRESVRRLAARLPIEALCFAHGPPILAGAADAVARALAADAGEPRRPHAD